MLLGAHTSISGGLYKSLERGAELGCECVQIFSKNQQQWNSKPMKDEEVEDFKAAEKRTGITRFFIHDSYLINLGSPDDAKWQRSIDAFKDELDRADRLGAEVLVFHPGAHLKQMTDEQCCDRVADALNEVLKGYKGKCKPAIENTAGQGSNIGWRFEHIARIIDGVKRKAMIATCYDTAHAFAAGYDERDKKAWNATMDEYDKVVGIKKHLRAFHINDSKVELGRRVDRHENLGHGHIGLKCFELLVNDKRLEHCIGALETPMETHGGHEADLKILLKFRKR
ncbi:MAG: deoxyribonuclease IV [Planctomycetes bacterium]|nr:deoxyribonuclease IV [Planctomycetota bacterium]